MKILSQLLDIQIDRRYLIWNIDLMVCSIFMLCKAMRPKEIISTMSVHRDKTREMRSNVAKIIRKGEESLGHGR